MTVVLRIPQRSALLALRVTKAIKGTKATLALKALLAL
jgi:hypothetical protein